MAVQRENPYANFNFIVDLGFGEDLLFAEAEIPAAEIEAIEYREGGDRTSAARKLPGRVRYGNVVLRRGISGRLELWEWFKAVRDGQPARRDVTITLLDEARSPVQQWRLRDAWPAKFDASDLNAKGNEVVIETLELAVESIDVE
ncbi:MAG: phage tail protein [Gaiellaceae bacterium]